MDDMTNIGNQFKGLPIEDLISAPLRAAVESNVNLAKATAQFINEVGFQPTKDDKGNTIPGAPRMADFTFERPGTDANGNPTVEEVKIKVPMLAIVPIPNLQVDNVYITFDMEVKNSVKSTDSSKNDMKFSAEASVGVSFFKASASFSGAVSTFKENTRQSDNSAKYHVEVKALNQGMPEGLSRVLDIMQQSVQPRQVKAYKPTEKGELPRTDTGTPDSSQEIKPAEKKPE